jgi:hypothetical protein
VPLFFPVRLGLFVICGPDFSRFWVLYVGRRFELTGDPPSPHPRRSPGPTLPGLGE